jgi:carboxyl-terminal processing protease
LLKLIKKKDFKGNYPNSSNNSINPIPISTSFATFSEQLRFSLETMVPIVTVFVFSAFNKNAMTLKKKLVIGAASFVIVCISVAKRLMPLVYPIEVMDITNTTSMTSHIQKGDRILSIEQKIINGWSLKKVNEYLEDGYEDDPVTLNIIRPDLNIKSGNSSEVVSYTKMDVVVNRKRILSRKVTTTVLPESQGPGLGYLAIEEFTDNTLYEVERAMDELDKSIFQQQKRHLRGLIIDLRGNPGGPLPPALDLAALFLPRGKVITQMGIQGQCEIHKSLNRKPNRSLSLLVLADGNTASASEIFIASLQDNARAKCMGTRTVGKNVAQAMMMLSDGSGLAFTVREYHSPLGHSMGNGIKPDIEIHDFINIKDILFDIKNSTWSLKQINFSDIDN